MGNTAAAEQLKLDLGYRIVNRGYGGDGEAQQRQCKLSVMRAGRKKKEKLMHYVKAL